MSTHNDQLLAPEHQNTEPNSVNGDSASSPLAETCRPTPPINESIASPSATNPSIQSINPVQITPPLHNSVNSSPASGHRRNGHIACLPLEVRDQINRMLDDGVRYKAILRNLGPEAAALNEDHIGSWKRGGYQDYLEEKRRRADCLARTELTLRLAAENKGLETYQATPKVAVGLLCETLIDLGPEALRKALSENPLNAFRLLNALARLVSGGLKCEKHIADEARSKADPTTDPKGFTPEGLAKVIQNFRLK